MSNKFKKIEQQLQENPKTWLITGVAGFIGSNLLEYLLSKNQIVVGLDNFATGHQTNLNDVKNEVCGKYWNNFSFIEGDICNYETCELAVQDVNYVLHQAALGSVPRSINDPINSNCVNIGGFLNILHAAKEAQVDSFTYAASSSTYGDHPALPKVEKNIGNPLSPYAVTKYVNELYAGVYARTYDFQTIGLRYFNVFGKRQDPNGPYAAVIPKWLNKILANEPVVVYGDGETSRDFCYIDNVIQMNVLAALAPREATNEVYNVAFGGQTTLIDLYNILTTTLSSLDYMVDTNVDFENFRKGDVRHSRADITKAKSKLGYEPLFDINKGMGCVIPWYLNSITRKQ